MGDVRHFPVGLQQTAQLPAMNDKNNVQNLIHQVSQKLQQTLPFSPMSEGIVSTMRETVGKSLEDCLKTVEESNKICGEQDQPILKPQIKVNTVEDDNADVNYVDMFMPPTLSGCNQAGLINNINHVNALPDISSETDFAKCYSSQSDSD